MILENGLALPGSYSTTPISALSCGAAHLGYRLALPGNYPEFPGSLALAVSSRGRRWWWTGRGVGTANVVSGGS